MGLNPVCTHVLCPYLERYWNLLNALWEGLNTFSGSLLSGLDNMAAMLCNVGRQAVDMGQFIQASEWVL